jgi:hypothetical protein
VELWAAWCVGLEGAGSCLAALDACDSALRYIGLVFYLAIVVYRGSLRWYVDRTKERMNALC